MQTVIKWIDYSEENLREAYRDYVDRILADKKLNIVTNVLCLVPYKKPKINNGINGHSKVDYIKTEYKIMTSTLLIKWHNDRNEILFSFGNLAFPLKFAKMEDV